MKILHVCLSCFYVDNYSYQENILPKYHKLMGHEVKIIASTETFNKLGEQAYTKSYKYINEDGIPVVRLPYVKYMPFSIVRKLRRYQGLSRELEIYTPDFIFIHGTEFLDIDKIRDYAQKHDVIIVTDCHTDFSNSARNLLSRYILHGIIYRHCAKIIEPYVKKMYGVLPARVDYLRIVFGMPESKTDLLVMGAEDDKVEQASNVEKIKNNRDKYGIKENDFLIVFGGKINAFKRQILMLMDVVNEINDNNLKLIIFGSVMQEMKSDIDSRLSHKVKYIGWANVDQSYDYFAMADVVCFPGRHSVYWEQVAGMGIPMIVKEWAGTKHIDSGGNIYFLKEDSKKEMRTAIDEVKNNYMKYKEVAERGKYRFLYSKIAEKSLS